MSKIGQKDTKPELVVRRLLHKGGYRFRLHRRDLPGTPDLVFPSRKKVVLVNGCFWHWHPDPNCRSAKLPKSRTDYWRARLSRNRERDAATIEAIAELGWSPLVVWECELRDRVRLADKLSAFLGPPGLP